MPAGITILIPTHNRAAILARTLEHIAASDTSACPLEIVVIDNNSTDNTRDVVEQWYRSLPVRYLHEPKPGKNCALNKAIRECELKDITLFIDDDITPARMWLHEILAATERWPLISVFGARVKLGWPGVGRPSWLVADWILLFGFGLHDYGDVDLIYGGQATPMGACFWVRTSILSAAPAFDEGIGPRPKNRLMGSEVAFLNALQVQGYQMVYAPTVEVFHRISPADTTVAALTKRAFRYGRGEARVYGMHRRNLFEHTRALWYATMIVDATYAAVRLLAGHLWFLVPQALEIRLRAMIRVGKIYESWRILRGREN